LKPGGWVLESLDGRTLMSLGDDLFLEMSGSQTIPPGEEFQILRKVREVRHPETRKRMGTLVRLMGFVKTTGPSESGVVPARVLLSNDGIQAGDLVTQGVMLPQSAFYSKPTSREIKGCIVTSLNNTDSISQYDVCFIDRGVTDGVEVGDSFWVMKPGKKVKGHNGRKVTLPASKIGTLVVLFTEKNSSTALVTQSDPTFQVGAPVASWTE